MLSDIKPINNYVLDNKRMQKALNYVAGYKMGYTAHEMGISIRNCPLDRLDPMRKGWKKGWKNANRKQQQVIVPTHIQFARTPLQNSLLKIYR